MEEVLESFLVSTVHRSCSKTKNKSLKEKLKSIHKIKENKQLITELISVVKWVWVICDSYDYLVLLLFSSGLCHHHED